MSIENGARPAPNAPFSILHSPLLLALLLLCALPLCGIKVHSRVTDANGIGLDAVLIRSAKAQTLSFSDGSFSIEAADSLHISRLGYESRSFNAAFVPKQIVLNPVPVQLGTYRVYAQPGDGGISAGDKLLLRFDADRSYGSTTELLSQNAALQSIGTNLKGEVAALSILGNLPRHTLVMVDGVVVNPGGDPYDFSRLQPGNIESIEIIKNNAGVYGGGSAIGGIVNITTKQSPAARQSYESKTELGSYGYVMQSVELSGAAAKSGYRIGMSGFTADNDYSYTASDYSGAPLEYHRENNHKTQLGLTASLATGIKGLHISSSADYSIFRRELPGPTNFLELYKQAFLEGNALRTQLRLGSKRGRLSATNLIWLNRDNTIFDNTRATLSAFRTKYSQELHTYGMRQSFAWQDGEMQAHFSGEAVSSGYLYKNLFGTPTPAIDSHTNAASLSASFGHQLQPWIIIVKPSAALRYDWLPSGEHLCGRAELSIRNWGTNYLELGGTVGNSFAVPSAYDLYWKGDAQAIGNPELKSESSFGYQAWAEYFSPRLRLKASGHRNEVENLIQWRQVHMNGTYWKPLNIGKAEIRNLELEGSLTPFKLLELNASALFTDAKDISRNSFGTAPNLMYRPDAIYALTLSINPGAVKLWSSFSFTGRQWTTPDNLIDPIPAYQLLDAGGSIRFVYQNWEISPHFSIKNLLDTRYEVHAYVPEPGISFYGGISLKQ